MLSKGRGTGIAPNDDGTTCRRLRLRLRLAVVTAKERVKNCGRGGIIVSVRFVSSGLERKEDIRLVLFFDSSECCEYYDLLITKAFNIIRGSRNSVVRYTSSSL